MEMETIWKVYDLMAASVFGYCFRWMYSREPAAWFWNVAESTVLALAWPVTFAIFAFLEWRDRKDGRIWLK